MHYFAQYQIWMTEHDPWTTPWHIRQRQCFMEQCTEDQCPVRYLSVIPSMVTWTHGTFVVQLRLSNCGILNYPKARAFIVLLHLLWPCVLSHDLPSGWVKGKWLPLGMMQLLQGHVIRTPSHDVPQKYNQTASHLGWSAFLWSLVRLLTRNRMLTSACSLIEHCSLENSIAAVGSMHSMASAKSLVSKVIWMTCCNCSEVEVKYQACWPFNSTITCSYPECSHNLLESFGPCSLHWKVIVEAYYINKCRSAYWFKMISSDLSC